MFGIEVKGISSAVAIAFAMALAMATVSAQPAHAAETGLSGPKIPHPIASAVPVGQTAEHAAASADTLRHTQEQDLMEQAHSNNWPRFTFGAPGGPLETTLDGVKLLGLRGLGADHKSGFDISVEFNGLGLQFEDQGTYGFMRSDRAISGSGSVGIRFRYRF